MLHRANSSMVTHEARMEATGDGGAENGDEQVQQTKRKRAAGEESAFATPDGPVFPANQTLSLPRLDPLPKSMFPSGSRDPEATFSVIEEELLLDGNAKQNLATFCQTWENDYARKIMELGMDKNLIDKDEYPQTAELEKRCVNMIANLWNAPLDAAAGDAVGCSTIGSSEAAMLGGMAAKWRWRNKRRAAGLSADRPNMVCGSVQICWKKFAVYVVLPPRPARARRPTTARPPSRALTRPGRTCRYWDIEMREIEMTEGQYCIAPEDVVKACDENTIMVVPTLGVTYHGASWQPRWSGRPCGPRRPVPENGAPAGEDAAV